MADADLRLVRSPLDAPFLPLRRGSSGLSGEAAPHPRGPQGASGRFAHFRRPRDRRPSGNDLSLSGETSSHPRGFQQAVPGLRTFHSSAGNRRLRGTVASRPRVRPVTLTRCRPAPAAFDRLRWCARLWTLRSFRCGGDPPASRERLRLTLAVLGALQGATRTSDSPRDRRPTGNDLSLS